MGEKESMLDNIEIHKNFLVVSVNPKFYPVSVIYSAAYAMLDKVHVIVDGDPNSEVLVELRPKVDGNISEKDLKETGYNFNDELINYSIYTIQATRTKKIREALMEGVFRDTVRGPEPPRRGPPQSIPQRFPQPGGPGPRPSQNVPDPMGIRKVQVPEEDRILDPKGIMKDNTRRDDCGCEPQR